MDNKKKFPQIDKNDIKQCQIKFSFLILNNVNSITQIKQNIINSISKSELEQYLIRPFTWKILLILLPTNEEITVLDWLKKYKIKGKYINKK